MSTSRFTKYGTLQDYGDVYYEAFQDYYTTIWHGMTEISNDLAEINDLCYHRCFSCFWFDSKEDYTDRQVLLYNYMRPAYKDQSAESIINKWKYRLPVDNNVKDLINDICTAYDETPTRVFSQDKKTNELMETIYQEGNVNNILQSIYPFGKLSGIVAVMPIFKEGKLHIIYSTADMFRVFVEPDNPFKVAKFIYPEYDSHSRQYVYHQWTDESYIITTKDGKEAKEIYSIYENKGGANRYGRIPVVFLRLGEGLSFIPGGLLDIVYNNLKINRLNFVNELCSGIPPVALGQNVKLDVISPDQPLVPSKPLLRDDMPVDFKWIQSPDDYIQKSILADSFLDKYKNKFKIPDDSAGESGISRIISRQGLIELRYKDIPKLITFEKDLADLIKHMANVDGLYNDELGELNLSIDFGEERIYIEPVDEMAMDKQKVAEYLMDIREYFKKWGGVDTTLTDNQFDKLLEKRKEALGKYKEKQQPDMPQQPVEIAETEHVQGSEKMGMEQKMDMEQNKIVNEMEKEQ